MTETRLLKFDVPAFEAVLLPDRGLIRRRAKRFVAIETSLFHPAEQPLGSVELAFRLELADQHRRPLQRFAVLARLAIQALREASSEEEKLPIPAVAIDSDGQPARRAELMLTVFMAQPREEPEIEPLMCFSLAHQDHTPLQSFALPWRQATLAVISALEAGGLTTASNGKRA